MKTSYETLTNDELLKIIADIIVTEDFIARLDNVISYVEERDTQIQLHILDTAVSEAHERFKKTDTA